MKKSLSKVLARMAKDGDIETVAGIIEEMIESAEGETVLPDMPEEAGEQPEEQPETQNIIIDGQFIDGVLERLDRIISLLEPSAGDEASAEEEVTEAMEEALETAAAETEDPMAGEVAAAMEEILDPVASAILESEEEKELPEVLETGDALHAALAAVRPVLARMPEKLRRRMAGDIAARLRHSGSRRTADSEVYAALASARRRTASASADLGKRIMEKRNPNYMRNRPNL